MSTCIYDNPSTCRREWWRDGKVESFVSELVFYQIPRHMRPDKGRLPWVTGQIVGDPAAMKTTIQKVAHRGDK